MDPAHRRKFEDPDLLYSLAACIDFDALAPGLLTKGIMTAAMIDDIREEHTSEREICLLRRLPKRGPLAYDRFIGLLLESHMHQAVGVLTGAAVQEPHARPVIPIRRSWIQAFGGGNACPVVNSVHNQQGALETEPDSELRGRGTVGDVSVAELLVTPAKEWKGGPDIYNMVHSPRGLCIIINNYNFESGYEEREGSELDVQRMVELFSALHFKCVVHKDLSANDMKEVLSWAARSEEHWSADCLVVILMSHGDENGIFGSDGNIVHLHDDVYTLFNNEKCPALQGKPKIFFLQACRGTMDDNGTKRIVCDTRDVAPAPGECLNLPTPTCAQRVATWSDMFFVYATIRNYTAYRNEVIGSWLLSAVYAVFSKHAYALHLDELMHRVQDQVLQRSSHDGCKQTPEVKGRGWRKKLYFNPGLCKRRSLVESATCNAAGV